MTLSRLKHYSQMTATLLVAFLLLFSVQVIAQEDSIDYSEMSLEDLLNVEVVTASKQAESIWDAPAVITTITSDEIEAFGHNQLRDVLELATGVMPAEASASWYNVAVRGGDPSPINGSAHILLLINGRPIRESFFGTQNQISLSAFPVNAIDRIEVIRGPGSVLYGTNAFEGVVNIITKKQQESGFSVALNGASYSGKLVDFNAHYTKDDFDFNLAGRMFEEDGNTYETAGLFGAQPGADNNFQDNLAFNLTLGYKGFSLYYTKAEVDSNFMGLNSGSGFPLWFVQDMEMIDIGYEHKFSDDWSLKVNATQNDSSTGWDLDPRPGLGFDYSLRRVAEDTLFEATVFGQFNEKFGVVFGGVHENITGESVGGGVAELELDPYDENRWSAYTQFNYKFTDKFNLIFGGQYNKISNLSGDFVPRVGAIVNFSEKVGAKILYGEAFRSPTKNQTNTSTSFIGPNPGLEPETNQTVDLQLFYNASNFNIAFTYYTNDEEGLIIQTDDPRPEHAGFFDNLGSRTLSGFEIEGKFVPTENWYIIGSFVSQSSEGNDGVNDIDDISLAPDSIAKIGINYRNRGFSAAIDSANYSAFKDNIITFPTRPDANPESKSFNWITARVAYTFKLTKADLTIDLRGVNLGDEEKHTPYMENANSNTTSVIEGSTWIGGIKAKF